MSYSPLQFNAAYLKDALADNCIDAQLRLYGDIPSSNDEAKRLIACGLELPALVLAQRQSAGRGRQGRSFVSPDGGLYLSYILPSACIPDASMLPFYCGVALCNAVESISSGFACSLKWVNDLFVAGRKLAGILCERVDCANAIIIGIGVNLYDDPSLPADSISVHEAGVLISEYPREELCAAFIRELRNLFTLETCAVLQMWRKRDCLAGKSIICDIDGEAPYEASAVCLADDGRLIVQLPTGEERRLLSGDVRVKARR